MLYKKLIASLISGFCSDDENLKDMVFLFVNRDTFESLQLVGNKPISIWATEDTAIVTINLTKGLGLGRLTLKDFEYRDQGIDLDDMQTVVLFNVDGRYMIYDDTYSGADYNIDRFEFSIYLKETNIYIK